MIGCQKYDYFCTDETYNIKYNIYLPDKNYKYFTRSTDTISIVTRPCSLYINLFSFYRFEIPTVNYWIIIS